MNKARTALSWALYWIGNRFMGASSAVQGEGKGPWE